MPVHFLSRLSRLCVGGWLLSWLAGSAPALAQDFRPRTLPARPNWLTAAALGPTLPVGAVRGPAGDGFDLVTTLEYAFHHSEGLWVRGTIDALQFTATEKLAGPGYAYSVELNNSATSLLFDVGYRHPYGRLVPFVFVGAGASYVSSSQLEGQQNGQAQHLGAASGYAAAVRGGLGLEYRLFRSRLIPYLEVNVLALPDRQVGGERLLFVTPLLGLKFPI